MSNNITPVKTMGTYEEILAFLSEPGNIDSNKTLAKLIRKKPGVLTLTDSFGENVVHKVIRSGHDEYMDTILAVLNEKEWKNLSDQRKRNNGDARTAQNIADKIRSNELALLEKPNKFDESPIRLAVKLQDINMVRYLLSKNVSIVDGELYRGNTDEGLLQSSFDNGQGNYQIFIELLKKKYDQNLELRAGGDTNLAADSAVQIDTFLDYIRGIEQNGQDENTIMLANRFRTKYEQYLAMTSDSARHQAGELDDVVYAQRKQRLIALLEADVSYAETAEIEGIINQFPSFVYDMNESNRKSILQYAIENGSFECFRVIFDKIKPERLKPSGNNTGDYFIIAMVNRNKKVMEFFLKRSKERNENYIMANYSTYTPGNDLPSVLKKNGTPVGDPLRIFFTAVDNEFNDPVIRQDILDFYGSNLHNPSYCEYILVDYIEEDIDKDVFYSISSRYKKYFDQIYMIAGQPLYQYLAGGGQNDRQSEIMLELLEYYIDKTDSISPGNYEEIQRLLGLRENIPGDVGEKVKNILALLSRKEEALLPLTRRPPAAASSRPLNTSTDR
jgi:hypothetical protein